MLLVLWHVDNKWFSISCRSPGNFGVLGIDNFFNEKFSKTICNILEIIVIFAVVERLWIAPLWNWNPSPFSISKRAFFPFESHHFGIETDTCRARQEQGFSLNRTTLELKLKWVNIWCKFDKCFESHHFGIETTTAVQICGECQGFESHHFGIET